MVKKRIPKKVVKIVQDYTERLRKQDKLPISKVVVFGSYAKGKTREWSDIDVCIVSPKFKDGISALQFLFQRREDEEVMAGLEPIGFSEKDFEEGSSLIQEIKKTGVLLKT